MRLFPPSTDTPRDTKLTPLIGNKQTYTTDPAAKRVVVVIVAPVRVPMRSRPIVDGTPVLASGMPIEYHRPGRAITIKTRGGTNDLLVIEELS